MYTVTIKVNLKYACASGELNQVSGQQDLDQSPEDPKAVVESEEGKHQIHKTFLD
jgi:hypothetical protein